MSTPEPAIAELSVKLAPASLSVGWIDDDELLVLDRERAYTTTPVREVG